MILKKDLKDGKMYKCKITEGYAKSQNEPSWANKVTTLKYTGFFFTSLKGEPKIFSYEADCEPIEEVK